MKLYFIPKTRLGRWSTGLSIAVIILMWTKIQYWLPIPTFAIAAFGLVGFIMGIMVLFKNKDKSILTFIPILVGLIIILWIAAELIFPH